jgi:predicted aspartyl protease
MAMAQGRGAQGAEKRAAHKIGAGTASAQPPASLSVKIVDGRVYVRAEINGRKVTLMLDTGSAQTVVEPEAIGLSAVETAKLPHVVSLGAFGENTVAVAREEVKVGKRDVTLTLVLAHVAPRQSHLPHFDGLLGVDFLSRFKSVAVSYQEKALLLVE